MTVDLALPGADALGRVFLTWAPVAAEARLVDPAGASAVKVTLRSVGAGGQVRFATTRTHMGAPTLSLTLPTSGAPVRFFVAGAFGRPSGELGDALIEARGTGSAGVLGSKPVTVRIRKDAQTLTAGERDRFLAALGTLNGGGSGRFRDFREMHVFRAVSEAHGNVGFLPWHRAYLLDLERELQAIDPTVTLPYWRFDRPAPKVFTRRFMGVPNSAGVLQFTAGHPFESWRTDNRPGIERTPGFAANTAPHGLRTEVETIALGGGSPNATYARFLELESDPHGSAHMSFRLGFINDIGTAARDPLFFMLHANVDRLWAKWQWVHRRTDPVQARAFAQAVPNRVGHRLADTMWPWNDVRTAPRPSAAPGGTLARSTATAAPGDKPTVRSMIDLQGVGGGASLGFAYDDVPFEL